MLQIEEIFNNVTMGEKAQKKDLQKAFGKISKDDIMMEILNKGDFQVSDLEREDQLENLKNDIANLV